MKEPRVLVKRDLAYANSPVAKGLEGKGERAIVQPMRRDAKRLDPRGKCRPKNGENAAFGHTHSSALKSFEKKELVQKLV